MQIVKPGYEIMDELDGEYILKKIERVARTCYKSEDKICEGSAEKMVRGLCRRRHEAMLEHFSFTVKFTVDRGVSHEMVRHRIASFAQESTRYCNYSGNGLSVIKPFYIEEDSPEYYIWRHHCLDAEAAYLGLLATGETPEKARCVLPTCLKTEIVVTMNLREWRHFFRLRALGTTGAPHPQIKEVTEPLLKELQEKIPVVFDEEWM